MHMELVGGASLRTPMTYQEYQALGETKHTEYLDGVVVVNPPSRRHVRMSRWLTTRLDVACPAGYEVLPEWGWRLAAETHVEPDIMIAPVNAPDDLELQTAPLLVVEIESPSTRNDDRGPKRQLYAAAGLPWYWRVVPDAGEIVVHQHDGTDLVEVQRVRRGDVTVGPIQITFHPEAQ